MDLGIVVVQVLLFAISLALAHCCALSIPDAWILIHLSLVLSASEESLNPTLGCTMSIPSSSEKFVTWKKEHESQMIQIFSLAKRSMNITVLAEYTQKLLSHA